MDNDVRSAPPRGGPGVFFGQLNEGKMEKNGRPQMRIEGKQHSIAKLGISKSLAMRKLALGASLILATGQSPARADTPQVQSPNAAQAPAPIGVFGVDMPAEGKWTFSFSPSTTRNQGSKIGTQSVSPQAIVSDVTSANTPVGSHLLRMAPKSLTTDGEALSIVYGLTSNVSLSASTSFLEKSVDMETFKGLSGLTMLGSSEGKTSGIGDTSIASVVRLYQDRISRVNLSLGASLPTGSTTENEVLLLPNNTMPTKRAFYAMQLGSGSLDLLPGASYSAVLNAWSWGLSYRGRIPLDHSGQVWEFGDLHEVNAWAGYNWAPGLEATIRLNGSSQGAIRGHDPLITGYAQGADPLYYGGRQVSILGGFVLSGKYYGVSASQIGLEVGLPAYQKLNGPQLGREYQVNLVVRYRL